MAEYPWYKTVEKDQPPEQGDFVYSCPIIVPPATIEECKQIEADVITYDVLIMSQSCDLANKKIDLVLVCPVWPLKVIENLIPHFKRSSEKEHLRRGHIHAFHLLNKSEIDKFTEDFLVVDFRNVYGVHYDFLIEHLRKQGDRLRLLPPYREHLAQAFARFFMRVGLPADIPRFK